MLTGAVSSTSLHAYPAPQTLCEVLGAHATRAPGAPAIIFEDLTELSYRALHEEVERVGDALRHAGVGVRDCVAIVMPESATLALTLASVACHATIIPLNPKLHAAEVEVLFASLGVDAVIVAADDELPAREIALRHHACLFEAAYQREGGLVLTLRTKPRARQTGEVRPDDPAMILRTSGTTARPKLVPVTHRNLQSMAARRQHWFALGSEDRGICIASLYYAQGLFNALFTQLLIGGSVAVPPRGAPADFCGWFARFAPTWYSAGPTVHRSVLEQARSLPKAQLRHRLRFIQSGAAPLPLNIHQGLESVFGAPVVDSYGLSEAGNIAANSIAPSGRRRNTLGRSWPDEVAIRDADGSIVRVGGPGELVLRGPGVTPGYIDDPEANRAAFADGWFRTGDLGRIDADGFVTVVGRIKELINRGGEKIAPVEIDEALQHHAAVAEAAAFAVPHPRLGEDVAAAVILRAESSVTPLELRRFLQASLAPFKVPRRIYVVSSFPKGETGKVLRQELSRRFATPARQPAEPWESPLEIEIAEIWSRLLGQPAIGPHDDFFESGGDSMLAIEMLDAIQQRTARKLPSSLLFEAATIRQLAQILAQTDELNHRPIFQLSWGSRTPFFFFHGAFNNGGAYTKSLASLLGSDQTLFVVAPHGVDDTAIPRTIEAMAAERLSLIREAQPRGPYRLGGYCLGGLVAFETARLLVAAGESIDFVAMVDPPTTNARRSVQMLLATLAWARPLGGPATERAMMEAWYDLTGADREATAWFWHLRQVWGAAARFWLDSLRNAAQRIILPSRATDSGHAKNGPTQAEPALSRDHRYGRAMSRYRPAPLAVRTIYFAADYRAEAWRRISPELEIIKLSGDHGAIVRDPTEIAQHLRMILETGTVPRIAHPTRRDAA